MTDQIDYPLYRKYAHGRTYFKVISEEEFEELRFENGRWVPELYKAAIYPDRTYLHELIHHPEKHWIVIGEMEYLEKRKLCT